MRTNNAAKSFYALSHIYALRIEMVDVIFVPDGTDVFDTLYIGCEKFPQHDLYSIAIGGVR